MTAMTATENSLYTQPSLAKQQLYSKYAKGEITRQELAEKIELIRPASPKVTLSYRIAAYIILFIATLFIPPYARRND
jgi:hypothetical protein